jgi:NADP-dependent 3-hydroxy acid dehydrogenase YdfG
METDQLLLITGALSPTTPSLLHSLLSLPQPYQIILLTPPNPKPQTLQTLQTLSQSHPSSPSKLHIFNIDITSTKSIHSLQNYLTQKFPGKKVQIIVHNLEIYLKDSLFNIENVRGTFAVNYDGTVE